VDTRGYAEGMAILLFISLFISALAEPLRSFTSAGLILPPAAMRPAAMRLISQLCGRIVSAAL
jgi:hypothetical protein